MSMLLHIYKQRKYVHKSEKRLTSGCTIKQLGLLITDRDMHLMTRNRTILTLWAPVKCTSAMCHDRIKVHMFLFFWSLQISQCTVSERQLLFYPSGDIFS